MWLLPPSIWDRFAPESGGSTSPPNSHSNTTESEPAAFLSLSGTPTLRKFSDRVWKNRPWSQRLFGAVICGSSPQRAFEDWWTASLPDSHARISRVQENGQASEASEADSGSTSCKPFAIWEQDGSFWRTSQRSLLADWTLFSDRWPKSGSMRNGRVYKRQRWVPAIEGNDGSAWPTARSHEVGNYQNQIVGSPILTLTGKARMWPTARSEDSESCGNHPDATESLTGATKQWGTPNSHERTHAPRDVHYGEQLANQVDTWTTPRASQGGSDQDGGGENRGGANLKRQVTNWCTPASRDHKGPDLARKTTSGPSLAQQTECATYSHQGQVLQTGKSSQKNSRASSRRLNPAFVNWLMGAPWWWTRAEPLSFAAAETASWYCRLRRHLHICLDES